MTQTGQCVALVHPIASFLPPCDSCGDDASDGDDAHAGPLRVSANRAFGEHWPDVRFASAETVAPLIFVE
jgi:hypothetical protein